LYNTIHNTLIIGKKIIYLPSCHSTNDIAAELVQSGIGQEGIVVITDYQTKGRGQRGTEWHSDAGLNLMFSVILKPGIVPIEQQFLISQSVALAIHDTVQFHTESAKIKWPNDIYAAGRKLSGTLIENSIQGTAISHSIVGIGININQLSFTSKATSLAAILGHTASLTEEFERMIRNLDIRYQQLLTVEKHNLIRDEYLSNLHGYQSPVPLNYFGEKKNGIVTGIADNGQILVKLDGIPDVQQFGLKEIEWVWGS
jgi:BirA family biotin operon repressor/biotin-[acetyl-CoA-carboxylase] ligase